MNLNHKYFVVQFLEKPYSTVDSEVCVPFNWIKLAKKTNDIVSAAYPAEYSPSTREMVRNICPQGNDWRYYKVQAKCGNRSFKAAEKYIKSRNNTESEKTECSTTEINENQSISNRNTCSSNQSSSPGPTTKKRTLTLRNNRTQPVRLSIKRSMPNISYKDLFKKRTKTVKTPELMSETPNHSNESGKKFNENKLVSLDLDCFNQEQHDTTNVKMSIVVSNTVERTVLESSAENESFSIPSSQSCQPLTVIHKQNTTNTPAQNSTDQSRCLSNQSHKHQSPARYTDSLHHNLQSENRPKLSSAKVKTLEDKIIVSSYSKAANPSLEVSNTSYNNQFFKANEPILYYDQHQRNISIERSRNANDNDQQTSPSALYRLRNMIAQISHLPNHAHNEQLLPIKGMDVYQEPCTQEILDRSTRVNPIDQSVHAQIATHEERCTQEILHRTSDLNRIEERACSQSATHQESRTQLIIDKSTEVNLAEQTYSSQSTTRNVRKRNTLKTIVIPIYPNENKLRFGVRKPPRFPNLLYEEGFSPVHENHSHDKVSLRNINSEKYIKIVDVNQNSQHSQIRQNTPSTVQNTSSSSNQSSCLWNGSSGKQISLVTQDQSISEPRHQERRIGKPSKLNHTEKSIYFKNNTENESFFVQNTPSTNQPIKKSCTKNLSPGNEHYMQDKFSPISQDLVDQEMSTQEITVEKTTENNHIETTTCPEINTEQESKVPNLSASFHTYHEVKSMEDECVLKVLKNTLKQMKLTIADRGNCNCNNTFGKFNEAIEQMFNVCSIASASIDRYSNKLKNNIAEPVSQEPPVKPEEKSANNKNKKSNNVELDYVADDDGDHDNDDDSNDNVSGVDNKYKDDTNENDDGCYELPKKKRGTKRPFVLPPEYDAHNSRWTLKYHAIEPGVVELMRHSKIYISSLKLANCKRVARDYKTFGRMLLVEIFSRNALSVCSLTGAKANAFDVHESDIRPGLDKEARSILLTYVENYGRKQGWGSFDTNSVVNSLRSKIQEMRGKYGSTV